MNLKFIIPFLQGCIWVSRNWEIGVAIGPSDTQGPLSTQPPAKISILLICGHQSPRCFHPVSPRVSPCCCSILFLGTEVICQVQDLFCCFYSLPGYWTVYEQHLRMLPQRQSTKTLTPELSEIYVLTTFFQTLLPSSQGNIQGRRNDEWAIPLSLIFLISTIETKIHPHSKGFRLWKTKAKERPSQPPYLSFIILPSMSTKKPSCLTGDFQQERKK